MTDSQLILDSTGGAAWPFSVGRVTCLVSPLARIDRLIALSFDSMDRGAWPFFVDGVTCLVNSVSVCEEKRKRRERMKEKRREKMKDKINTK